VADNDTPLDQRIEEVANSPARAANDSGSIENQNLKYLIEADKYLSAKKAAQSRNFGLRLGRIKPGDTV